MNIEFYRNYIEIVDSGTLSAAAREIHVAQSALSNQLKQFEEEYGAQLLIRSSRQMELTDAGRILYRRARDIIALVDASYKEIEACVEGSRGILRLGVTQAYPDTFINSVLQGFHNEHPEVRFELREEDSREILELLKAGVIEVGFTRISGVIPAQFHEEASITEHMCVYCSKDNPWFDQDSETIDFASLDGVTLAISRGIEDQLNEMFQRADIHPEILCVSTSRSNTMMWAHSGKAVGIIRTSNSESLESPVSFRRPLSSSDEVIESMLHTSRSALTMKNSVLSAVGQLFVDYVRNYIKNNERNSD